MKKNTVVLLISLLCVIASVIVAADYYRSIYVISPQDESVYTESNEVSDVFLEEEITMGEKKSANLCFFGDNMIHENVLNYANLLAGGKGNRTDYDKGFHFAEIYRNVIPYIEEADFAVINQATLVGANDSTNALSGYPLFNSPTVLGKELISIGFDGVNIGNNHLLDMGYSGLKNSVEFWRSQDIAMFGGYLNEEDKKNVENKIVDINDIRFSFLSFTANTNGLYVEGGDHVPYFTLRGSEVLIDMLNEEVKKCSECSDVVVVMINWSNTAGFEVTDFQRNTAQILCDAGADVIIGSGPKTIQTMEWLTDKKGNKTLCAYSLGNFMGTMQYTENLVGGILNFDVVKENEQVLIADVVFHPTVIHYDENYSDISVYPLEEYDPEMFSKHGSNINFGDTDYNLLYDIVKKNIPVTFHE